MDAATLLGEVDRLVAFARTARRPEGFGWLDEHGALTDRPVELWITCRMTHVFALQALRGDDASAPLARHGVEALTGALRDAEHGGWFAAVDAGGPVAAGGDKQAYGHAFVVLAAASATAAGTPGAERLLREALDVVDRHFWDDRHGMVVDGWDRGWTTLDPYRGVNANMHLVEALLAAHEVAGDATLLDRALRVTTRVVHDLGPSRGFRLPEHFSSDWEPQPDHNRDDPAHPFQPYGVTVGHLLEWSRLTLLLGRALASAPGREAPGWLLPDARGLFDRAVADGWSAGEHPGFCYTTDFDGRPVVTHRMHWVVAEAVAAAETLHRTTGEASYAGWRDTWLDLALTRFADPEGGSWWHEVDERNQPSREVWQGKPDVYHAYQALLTPLLPPASSYVGAVLRARAEHPQPPQ